MRAERRGDLRRIVETAVVDDNDCDLVNTRNRPRQPGNRRGQRRRFVATGNLDNDFHRRFGSDGERWHRNGRERRDDQGCPTLIGQWTRDQGFELAAGSDR